MIKSLSAGVRSTAHLAKAFLLLLVLLQFSVVIIRYIFGVNFLWAQEAALAAHGAIFMLAAGWTFMAGKHVAIDVFSSRFPASMKRAIGQLGFLFLLFPMMAAVMITSAAYVGESWIILEGSKEVSGLPGTFLFKTLIPAFALLMIAAGLMLVVRKSDQDFP